MAMASGKLKINGAGTDPTVPDGPHLGPHENVPCTCRVSGDAKEVTVSVSLKPGNIGIFWRVNRITRVEAKSQAHKAGIKDFWTIVGINGSVISEDEVDATTEQKIKRLIADAQKQDNIIMTFIPPICHVYRHRTNRVIDHISEGNFDKAAQLLEFSNTSLMESIYKINAWEAKYKNKWECFLRIKADFVGAISKSMLVVLKTLRSKVGKDLMPDKMEIGSFEWKHGMIKTVEVLERDLWKAVRDAGTGVRTIRRFLFKHSRHRGFVRRHGDAVATLIKQIAADTR